MALDGDTIMIGSRLDDNEGTHIGSAYVFVRSGMTWTQKQKLVSGDGVNLLWDFVSEALDGNTAVIAAQQDDDKGTHSTSACVALRSI